MACLFSSALEKSRMPAANLSNFDSEVSSWKRRYRSRTELPVFGSSQFWGKIAGFTCHSFINRRRDTNKACLFSSVQKNHECHRQTVKFRLGGVLLKTPISKSNWTSGFRIFTILAKYSRFNMSLIHNPTQNQHIFRHCPISPRRIHRIAQMVEIGADLRQISIANQSFTATAWWSQMPYQRVAKAIWTLNLKSKHRSLPLLVYVTGS